MNKSPGQAGASFPWGSPHEQIDRDHRTRPRRLGGELRRPGAAGLAEQARGDWIRQQAGGRAAPDVRYAVRRERAAAHGRNRAGRSEEHTSELQSLMRISYAVFCLKKKKENQ